MVLRYRAAVLHAPQTPLWVETVTTASLKPTDVLVRMINDGFAALKQNQSQRHYIRLIAGQVSIVLRAKSSM